VPALAGANMIYGVGMLDSALTWDYASALLQNEFLDMVLKIVEGIKVSEENIAYDVIKDVGPAGEFLTHDHTLTHCRELSQTKLMNRNTRESWEEAGSPDIVELAYEKSIDILENYTPTPRPENIQKELDSIYSEFEEAAKERKARAA
jgi:trimethylamine--corrinoid protein Co-methyltransferase